MKELLLQDQLASTEMACYGGVATDQKQPGSLEDNAPHLWMLSSIEKKKEQPLFERASRDLGGGSSHSRQRWVFRFNEEVGERDLVTGKV